MSDDDWFERAFADEEASRGDEADDAPADDDADPGDAKPGDAEGRGTTASDDPSTRDPRDTPADASEDARLGRRHRGPDDDGRDTAGVSGVIR
ncbi:hypothetical protein [Halogeometricum sp. CBA1124]|uniref:hypothetical protein n=1 Tax=Halogeometricum sp. CBA1124 TaxID=2668071 RepID=UPI00142B2B0C|nr:hypothetical protein [Halogeometricum sp. CBA1124]MUV56514.1 hypothetical protein [Halogeometricum sp. CBA1124]